MAMLWHQALMRKRAFLEHDRLVESCGMPRTRAGSWAENSRRRGICAPQRHVLSGLHDIGGVGECTSIAMLGQELSRIDPFDAFLTVP